MPAHFHFPHQEICACTDRVLWWMAPDFQQKPAENPYLDFFCTTPRFLWHRCSGRPRGGSFLFEKSWLSPLCTATQHQVDFQGGPVQTQPWVGIVDVYAR